MQFLHIRPSTPFPSLDNATERKLTKKKRTCVTLIDKALDIGTINMTAWFEAARILCSMSVVLIFTLIVASAFLHFVDGKREDFHYIVVGTVLSAALGTAGCIVFAARSRAMLDTFSGELAWGWAVFLTSQLLAALLVICFFYLVKAKRRRPRLRPVAPTREIIF
ncbi:hypothetical protein ElyMa_000163000 [Elysia marginata]|uniref:MARVEL domain-containing protein n=1 Tax=Elysia marginata TaxID=1093978 RepID=A0AAV4ERX7_9GAST|nr:hypothetical protein ElyMa_000163000 [Elysia marginata]